MLTSKQRNQIELQIKAHKHKKYEANIEIAKDYTLKRFVVLPKVLRPEVTTSLFLGRWLYQNKKIYLNKRVLDMGSGTGFLGIIVRQNGSSETIFTDVSSEAVANTKTNIKKLKLTRVKIYRGDLFEKVNGQFDLIVFNHPFFGDVSKEYSNKKNIMQGTLTKRFLMEAKLRLKTGGKIVMPYFHLAGKTNNPLVQGRNVGYKVKEVFSKNVKTGLQQGAISIYILEL